MTARRSVDPPPRLYFVLEGEERSVDLGSVAAVRRGRKRVVQLLDLWVASLLPGDLLDLTFEIVGEDDAGATVRSARIAGPCLAHAYVALGTLRLRWEGQGACLPRGLVVRSIEVSAPQRSASDEHHPGPRSTAPPREALARVLPSLAAGYPPVEWRTLPLGRQERSPLHAYLLALGLLATG